MQNNSIYWQLQIFCIQDLVVISMTWLGSQLIGELLSSEFLNHTRVTGVYTAEDFQSSYNQCDALGVLELLKALELCISVMYRNLNTFLSLGMSFLVRRWRRNWIRISSLQSHRNFNWLVGCWWSQIQINWS